MNKKYKRQLFWSNCKKYFKNMPHNWWEGFKGIWENIPWWAWVFFPYIVVFVLLDYLLFFLPAGVVFGTRPNETW